MTSIVVKKNDDKATAYFDLGFLDAKGRQIGVRITQGTCDMVSEELTDENESWGYRLAPGHYFTLVTHSTRNGEDYGASQKTQYFTEREKMIAATGKYLLDAGKRAAKK